MKRYIFSAALLVVLLFSGCKDDPASPVTIEEKINKAKPFCRITIYQNSGGVVDYEKNTTSSNYNDVIAEEGFLIVTNQTGTHYYNLSAAREILIDKTANYNVTFNTLTLKY